LNGARDRGTDRALQGLSASAPRSCQTTRLSSLRRPATPNCYLILSSLPFEKGALFLILHALAQSDLLTTPMLRSTSRSPARLSHSARHRPSGSYSGREIISSRPIRRIALLAIILCSIPLLLWQIGFSLWGRKSRVIIDPLLGDRGSSLGVAETLQEEDGSKEWPSILTTGSAGDIRIIWKERVPPSRLLAHAPGASPFLLITNRLPSPNANVSKFKGWTILENVILLNGTIYIISDDPTAIPSIKTIMSNGIPIPEAGPMSDVTITPGQMQIIGTWDARELFGRSAGVLDGTTFLCSDAPQCT
jgi:hypothetical protein